MNDIRGGWERLPLQLLRLDANFCSLMEVPAALVGRNVEIEGIGCLYGEGEGGAHQF